MKRLGVFSLLLLMVCSVSLWGLRPPENGKTYNRDKNYRGIKERFGQCQGWDSDGPLSAIAETQVNVEYPTEWPPNWRWGVETKAYARVKGAAPHEGYNGYWLVDAYVPNDTPDWDADTWFGSVDEKAEASDFDWGADDEVEDAEAVENILSGLDANASISGGGAWGSGSSGSTGPAPDSNSAVADGNWETSS